MNKTRQRTTAALTAATILMGGAVFNASAAAAQPRPQVGKPCPARDVDFNGIYTTQYRLIQETWAACTYHVYKYTAFTRGRHYDQKFIKGGGVLR